MCGAIHSFPQYASMAWCLVKHRDNFTFHLLPLSCAEVCIVWRFISAPPAGRSTEAQPIYISENVHVLSPETRAE